MFKIKYGFIKPSIDAHTMGLYSASELLKECGYDVLIADEKISLALDNIRYEENRNKIITWLKENGITHIGISYRLDEIEAANIMGFLVYTLKNSRMFSYQGGQIFSVIFGGLPKACEIIDREHNGFVKTFIGGETPYEFLTKIGVPDEKIPKSIIEGSFYDENRLSIGKEIIKSGKYQLIKPIDRSGYKEFGTKKDSVIKRLEHNLNNKFLPLMRAHVGPYSSTKNRIDSVKEFLLWAKKLADAGYLDILSIGTSQLTQSNFGEDWGDKPNGGGVPINSPEEYKQIWQCSRPLLIRTYAGTKNIPQLAKIHEETINICWHALSLWWFNKLDGRGPYDLYTNLLQHVETMKYIAKTNKPLEPNVSHHFSFRGGDDVTYIVTAYLAAKLAKKWVLKL
ncbi:hypothetical protein SAMN02745227_01091 [Anaerobranca californiensis DSM 14826]|jgi:hypothetical protein|uniref:Cobalamin-binding protein n=1 Tax=Anaerobranca californiensis DSM 14826 TaxID=1120989 RepID=A0A1M6NAM0_9FIRM|nr:hypothetical protein [Anaerobranca californiensis]SHJ92753.1 hypothetical protein SAMN02745227_01091 [Anaerobranca californiensis DSM 14826]